MNPLKRMVYDAEVAFAASVAYDAELLVSDTRPGGLGYGTNKQLICMGGPCLQ